MSRASDHCQARKIQKATAAASEAKKSSSQYHPQKKMMAHHRHYYNRHPYGASPAASAVYE